MMSQIHCKQSIRIEKSGWFKHYFPGNLRRNILFKVCNYTSYQNLQKTSPLKVLGRMHCMLMDLLHGFEVLSTTEETLFNSRNVSRLVQNRTKSFRLYSRTRMQSPVLVFKLLRDREQIPKKA